MCHDIATAARIHLTKAILLSQSLKELSVGNAMETAIKEN